MSLWIKGFACAYAVFAATAFADDDSQSLKVKVNISGSGVEHLNAPDGSLVCSGGGWNFKWADTLTTSASSGLGSNGKNPTFFNKVQNEGAPGQRSFAAEGVICDALYPDSGEVFGTVKGFVLGGGNLKVDPEVSFEPGDQYVSLTFDNVGICQVSTDGSVPANIPISFGLYSSAGMSIAHTPFSPSFSITREMLKNGFRKKWQVSSDMFAPTAFTCTGIKMQGEVGISYKSAGFPEIEFDECTHLAAGEAKQVTAYGTPEDGTYAFEAAPSSLFDISHSQPRSGTARLRASTPGRGSLTARYSLNGDTAEATVEASVVDFKGFTGAPDEIELSLMDAEGRATNEVINLPIGSAPEAAGDLLVFKAENPSLISVAPALSHVDIQAVKKGETFLNTYTRCGVQVGKPLKVKVLQCSRETKEQTDRNRRMVKERIKAIQEQVADILRDDEFIRVENEIEDDVTNLWIKTSESIVGTLSLGNAKRLESMQRALKAGKASQHAFRKSFWLYQRQKAVEAATQIYDVYDFAGDTMGGVNAAFDVRRGKLTRAEGYDDAAKGVLAVADKLIDNEAVSLGKSYAEAAMAAQKMGQDLGTMIGAADRLAELYIQMENLAYEQDRTDKLAKKCNDEQPDDEETKRKKRKRKPDEDTDPEPDTDPQPEPDTEPQPEPEPDVIIDRVDETEKPKTMFPMCVDKPTNTPDWRKALRQSTNTAANESILPGDMATVPYSIQDLSSAMKAEQREMFAMADRLQRRADKANELNQWMKDLSAAVRGGQEQAVAAVPELRERLTNIILENAQSGDDSLDELDNIKRCPSTMEERGIDIRKVKWAFN